MSVQQRLEDAQLLVDAKRYEGALLSVCAALSATSRKRYPDRKMGDRKAFIALMDEEICVVTGGAFRNVFIKTPGADLNIYPDQMMPLQVVLYQFVRCALAHEASLAENIEVIEHKDLVFSLEDHKLRISQQILSGLANIVRFAPENLDDFPDLAELPQDIVAWNLFGKRREKYADYMNRRQSRLDAIAAKA